MDNDSEPMREPFVWQLRVYWEDTDGGGVVYHSRYLNFFERARTEWLRSLGVDQAALAQEQGLLFMIRRIEVDFHRPARLDDELSVSVHSLEAGGSRLHLRQEILNRRDGTPLAEAAVTAATLDARSLKPARIPDWIRAEIEHAE